MEGAAIIDKAFFLAISGSCLGEGRSWMEGVDVVIHLFSWVNMLA
jgi:hypothetical protein